MDLRQQLIYAVWKFRIPENTVIARLSAPFLSATFYNIQVNHRPLYTGNPLFSFSYS